MAQGYVIRYRGTGVVRAAEAGSKEKQLEPDYLMGWNICFSVLLFSNSPVLQFFEVFLRIKGVKVVTLTAVLGHEEGLSMTFGSRVTSMVRSSCGVEHKN